MWVLSSYLSVPGGDSMLRNSQPEGGEQLKLALLAGKREP